MQMSSPLPPTQAGESNCRIFLTDETELLRLGTRDLLFSATQQKLFALNGSAARVATMLDAKGCTIRDLVQPFLEGGMDFDAAERMLHDLILNWSKKGIAAASFPEEAFPICAIQELAIGSVRTRISYGSRRLATMVSPLFNHLPKESGGSSSYHLVDQEHFTLIRKNGGSWKIVAQASAGAALKAYLTEDILAATGRSVALHAATLMTRHGALLAAGRPGAGKSTFAIALAEAGYGYRGDDIAILAEDGTVDGIPFAPAVKPGAWRLFRERLRGSAVHLRLDGKQVRYLPLSPVRKDGPSPIAGILKLRRNRTGPASLRVLEPSEALISILGEAYTARIHPSAQIMISLTQALNRARSYELSYSDLGEAVQAVANEFEPA